MGHHIVMGRKTYESIGKPLPGRISVVVSRNAHYVQPGVVLVNSLESAILACPNDDEIFVIGGAEIYRQAIALADRIYLTQIDADISGDAYFTELDPELWPESAASATHPDEKNRYALSLRDLRQKAGKTASLITGNPSGSRRKGICFSFWSCVALVRRCPLSRPRHRG